MSKEKYTKLFSNIKDYDEQADLMKKEFMQKFNKEELFELLWSYRTVLKYLTYEVIHPGKKEAASHLLKTAEEVAILSTTERLEKDGKLKKKREVLTRDLKNKDKGLN